MGDTPFSDIIDVVYQDLCEWHLLGPMWEAVSSALLGPHLNKKLEVVVNRGHQGVPNATDEEGKKAMDTSFFWLAEVPELAKHPPQGGLQFLAKEDVYPCKSLMPDFIAYLESLGA